LTVALAFILPAGWDQLAEVVTIGSQHAFFREFRPFEQLKPYEKRSVVHKVRHWRPPGQGMQ
jgi:hypothetical protein